MGIAVSQQSVSQSASPERAWGISWGAHIEQRSKIKDIAREIVVNNIRSGPGLGGSVGHNSNSFRGRQSSIHPSCPHHLIGRCLSASWKPTVAIGRCRRSSIGTSTTGSGSGSGSGNTSTCSVIHQTAHQPTTIPERTVVLLLRNDTLAPAPRTVRIHLCCTIL